MVGCVFVALSLTPSLVPRPALLQGVLAGLSFGLGYAIGVALSKAVRAIARWAAQRSPDRFPTPSDRARRIAWWGLLSAVIVSAIVMSAVALGWQNEVRALVEMEPVDSADVSTFALATIITSAVCLGIGRLVRALHGWLVRLASRLPRMNRTARFGLAFAVTTAIVIGAGWGIGALGMTAVDSIYASRNVELQPDLTEPDSEFRSAGDDSAVSWNRLGRHGRTFIGGGPDAEEIEAVTGEAAIMPIRVYVGMAEGGSLEARAALAVEELERTGAFDRRVLVVATTTGSGWLEDQSVDSLEYLHGGDTAIVSMQYAYTPSWVSFLFDQDLPVAASEALFTAVHAAWSKRPADDRPQLIAYGLSLGAHGMQSVFTDLDDVRARTDGAVFVGSPGGTPLWNSLQDARSPGSPAWQPVLDDGREVRWLSNAGDFDALPGPWDTPRVAYLQHATDPVTWLVPSLLWRSPEWLEDGQRGEDVSPSMRWIPVVTGLQVIIDMLMGESVPARHGHNYGDVILGTWQAVTVDSGLPDDAIDRIQRVIEGYAEDSPITE